LVAPAVIAWQRVHGRNTLPWQNTKDPYRVWLSEIMLQQTQVTTVIPYYEKFLLAFPDIHVLASAPEDQVLALWAGLGYYTRARNLHKCAKEVVHRFGGQFPSEQVQLMTLPGIGRSTAAAIAAFCFGQRTSIMDGNVRRVFCRFFGIEGDPTSSKVQDRLWALAEQALPSPDAIKTDPESMSRYTQGLMDLGAMICTRRSPRCDQCPLADGCIARHTGRTETLPSPKARKARPQQHCHVLLVRQSGQVWLCKRPQTGIWAGLWSLPEASTESELWQRFGELFEAAGRPAAMAAFRHELTHLRLLLQPWHLELPTHMSANQWLVPGPESAWVDARMLHQFGLPAPILPLVCAFTQDEICPASAPDDCY